MVGAFTSFGLALLFWGIMKLVEQAGMPAVILGYLAWINLALGIFNLVPAFPLDGGRVFRAIWWWNKGSLIQATRLAADMGKGFAVALMILGGLQIFVGGLVSGLWFIFIGLFLRGMAEGSYREVLLRRHLENMSAGEIMIEDVVTASPEIHLDELVSNYFLKYAYRGFAVVENGKVKGVVSLSALKGVPEKDRSSMVVKEVMTSLSDELQIAPGASLSEALHKMTQGSAGRLIVMRQNEMVGLVTRTDLLRFLEVKRALES